MMIECKSRFMRLVDLLQQSQIANQVEPADVVGALLSVWCKRSFPGLGRSGLPSPAKLHKNQSITQFVRFLQDSSFEEAIFWLSSVYSILIGTEYRRNQSLYFTPPALAKRLLDDLACSGADFSSESFFDPACGGAAFLAPIAIRIKDALKKQGKMPATILRHIESNILGVDKDPILCALSCHFLKMALHGEIIGTNIKPRFMVWRGDSLNQCIFHKPINNVVCNPPFRKMSSDELRQYGKEFDGVVQAQPNIYALFVAQCVNLVKDRGRCAFITPTSFLSGKNFSSLRNFLMHETQIKCIGMVSDRKGVFMDVLQETALTILQKRSLVKRSVTKTQVFLVNKIGEYIKVGRCALPNSGSIWPIPRASSDMLILKSALKSQFRLIDYGYTIRIGNFVWNRDQRTTYFSARSAAKVKNYTVVPLLWSSDVRPNGRLRFDGNIKSNGEPCFIRLESNDHPSLIRRPSVLLQRVTSNDQPKRLTAAAVPVRLLREYGGFVGENHTVVLEQTASCPALSPPLLARLLRSPVIDRYFRCISGATNVSSFELNQLALPSPTRLKRCLAEGFELEEAAERSF